MTTWFVSDTHFQHSLVAGIRGEHHPEAHISIMAHDAKIVNTWNSYIRPDDFVWHLGDVGLGNREGVLAIVAQLNGHKNLIAGNHDPVHPMHRDARKLQRRWLEVFDSVQAYAKIKITGLPNSVLLSHLPWLGDGEGGRELEERYGVYRFRRDDALPRWLIHGLTHSADKVDGVRSIHVGWDAWHRPVSLDEIRELIIQEA